MFLKEEKPLRQYCFCSRSHPNTIGLYDDMNQLTESSFKSAIQQHYYQLTIHTYLLVSDVLIEQQILFIH